MMAMYAISLMWSIEYGALRIYEAWIELIVGIFICMIPMLISSLLVNKLRFSDACFSTLFCTIIWGILWHALQTAERPDLTEEYALFHFYFGNGLAHYFGCLEVRYE